MAKEEQKKVAEIFVIFCVQLYAYFHLESHRRYFRGKKCRIHLMAFHSKFQFPSVIFFFFNQSKWVLLEVFWILSPSGRYLFFNCCEFAFSVWFSCSFLDLKLKCSGSSLLCIICFFFTDKMSQSYKGGGLSSKICPLPHELVKWGRRVEGNKNNAYVKCTYERTIISTLLWKVSMSQRL